MANKNSSSFLVKNKNSSQPGYPGSVTQNPNFTAKKIQDCLDSTMGELNLPNDLYENTSDSVGLHYETNDNGMSLNDAVEAMMMQSLQSLSIHNPHHSSKIVQPSSSNSLCNGEQLVWPQPQDRNQPYHNNYNYNYNNNNDNYLLASRRLVLLAKDRDQCRFLQWKIDEGEPEEVERILCGVKGHLHELMTHPFGNYLVQKIFQARSSVISMDQMDSIALWILCNERKLRDVCMDKHGTRVVQKMLENIHRLSGSYACLLLSTMKRLSVALMKNLNGSYVILHCIKLFPPECKKVILEEVAKNCVDIATNQCGCSVMQKLMSHAGEEAIAKLVDSIISNAEVLAEDQYGNYVVQFLVRMESSPTNKRMINQLRGKYVTLSVDKHASNVVEHLLLFSEPNDAAIIVQEIMANSDFLNVLQNPYGNYVAQTALECAQGLLHRELARNILSNSKNLQSHYFGKKVLEFAIGSVIKGSQNSF